tara:strand:- start:1354 stop:1713 length:360 start_codon:yes stop_codon:yes gene_type:complete
MIKSLGLGTDIIRISRIEKILKSDKRQRFLNKIFSKEEISLSKKKRCEFEFFAGRFAAKEAIRKAMSSKNSSKIKGFKSINIPSQNNGKPFVDIKNFKKNIIISISHDGNYATAVCVMF